MFIAISAILIVFGYFFNHYAGLFLFCWISSIGLIFYQQSKKQLSFYQGFLWAVTVFSLLLFWLAMSLIQIAGALGIVGWIALIIWLSVISGVWFYSMRHALIAPTWIYWYIVCHWSLLPALMASGYCFLWPFNIFSELIPYYFYGFDHLILITMIFIAWCLSRAHQYWIFIVSSFIALCIMVCFCKFYRLTSFFENMPQAYVCIPEIMSSSLEANFDIVEKISPFILSRKYDCILMPESAFGFNVNDCMDHCLIWSDGLQDVLFVFGAHWDNKTVVCLLKNNAIIRIYEKIHLMPILERKLWKIPHKKTSFDNDDMICISGIWYQIFMCSELFFEKKQTKKVPIVLFYNDIWFKYRWVKQLAVQLIVSFSKKHNLPVFYISRSGQTNIEVSF